MPRLHVLFPFVLASGCLTPAVRNERSLLEDRLEQPALPRPPRIIDPQATLELFAHTVDLNTLIDEALRQNPRLGEARSRTRAALEDVKSAGSMEDPVFKIEVEAVPLQRPLGFDRAADIMFGFSQSFPFPGKLRARSESALASAQAQHELFRASQSEIIQRMKKAYFAYFMYTRELEIHIRHVTLLEDFERVTESRFRNGTALQQDVLKAQIELVMLHNDVIALEQRIESAKAEINTLLNRRVDAPLGKPGEVVLTEGRVDLGAALEKAMETRPELRALEHRVAAARAAVSFAEKDAWLPDLMAGVDYWQVPRSDDAWGGFVSINLPWLSGKKAAEARKSRHELRAEELAADRGARQVFFEIRDAYLRVEASRTSYLLTQGELLPKARQNVEVTRSSYENDKTSFLDLIVAERSLRDVELRLYRALAEFESARADLEQASGSNVSEPR